MSATTALLDEFHALVAHLEEEEHRLAERFRALFDKLNGDLPAVETEVKADAETVAHDAEVAAAPVEAEVAKDAEHVASEVAADVATVVTEAPKTV